jgi:hypothetical protein
MSENKPSTSAEGILKRVYFDEVKMSIVFDLDLNGRDCQFSLPEGHYSYKPGMDKAKELSKVAALYDRWRGLKVQIQHE